MLHIVKDSDRVDTSVIYKLLALGSLYCSYLQLQSNLHGNTIIDAMLKYVWAVYIC